MDLRDRFNAFKIDIISSNYDAAFEKIKSDHELALHDTTEELMKRAVIFDLGEMLCRAKTVDKNTDIALSPVLAKILRVTGALGFAREKEDQYRGAKNFLLGQKIGDFQSWENSFNIFTEVFGGGTAEEIMTETARELGIYNFRDMYVEGEGEAVSNLEMLRQADGDFYDLALDAIRFLDYMDEYRKSRNFCDLDIF